ncbi:hypothetical protein [Cognatishimia sp. MH4019]|uniref:hypothetical protein n=1 Tax=Cognatishimia sp. MH4019 TaxID=2854030 RepID=UPI001CD3FE5A|nr:hypothetical protein [Cognatishimia sp. MH4019]
MRTFPRLLIPLMVALMVLTSASLAVARAAPDAAGQMVLCTGSGPVVMHFDENGDPVGAPHYCPDCAMTLLAAVSGHAPVVEDLCAVQSIRFDAADTLARKAQPRKAQARDPPLV